MARRSLDNPQVQGDRARRGKARPQDRRLRAIERRLDYLEAEITGSRESSVGIVAQGKDAQLELNRFVTRVVERTGKFPPFLKPDPIRDFLCWIAEDMEITRAYVLFAPAAGALVAALVLWGFR